MKISDGKLSDYRDKMIKVEEEIKKVVIGIDDKVELTNLAIFSRGHVLYDGLPGVAKTMLCLAAAKTLGGLLVKFEGRPDFTPNQFMYAVEPNEAGDPKFYPLFLITKAPKISMSLLDEVTRFTSQSQAFWFEIMNEFRLTLPTKEIDLPHNRIFATKNKVTRGETFEIPQPQLDRFMANIELGYPSPEVEKRIIMDEKFDNPRKLVEENVSNVINLDELEEITETIQSSVQISEEIGDYIVKVMMATRAPSRFGIKVDEVACTDDLVDNRMNASGVSTRGGGKWRRIAKAAAFRRERNHILPEDLRLTAKEVLAHRIFLNLNAVGAQQRRATLAKDFVEAILRGVPSP